MVTGTIPELPFVAGLIAGGMLIDDDDLISGGMIITPGWSDGGSDDRS